MIGQTSAFKTSTGVELRFFMPVLNVPFRLIYAFNPQRDGVLDNNLRPAKEIDVPVRGRDDVLESIGLDCREVRRTCGRATESVSRTRGCVSLPTS